MQNQYGISSGIKWLIGVGVGTLALIILSLSSCTTVPPGYAGIKVNNFGTSRGVQHLPIMTGMVLYNPFSESVHKFPTFLQTEKWTKGSDEGSENDESITFNSIEGATINVDVGASVQFQFDSVPAIFVEFRKDAQEIIDGFIRNQIRDAFSRAGSQMKTTEIFGNGKRMLVDSVNILLKKSLGSKGILVDNISIIGEMRVDATVKASINAVLTATQRAIEAENKVAQSRAEAEQKVAEAKGDSASVVIRAQGDAQAKLTLRTSLTRELLEYTMLQKWDGVLPVVSGGSPLISIPLPKKAGGTEQ